MQIHNDISPCISCESRKDGAFACLDPSDLQNYLGSKSCLNLKKRTVLFNEGDVADAVYCVREGKFKLSRLVVKGRRQMMEVLGKGAVLGYHSLLRGGIFSFSAEALESAVVCRIPRERFLALVHDNPKFTREILDRLSRDFEQTALRACSLGQKSVRERMAETLLLLAQHHGKKVGERIKIDVLLNREDIAQMAGTVLETCVRFLTEFKNDGFIDLDGKHIFIKKIDGLLQTSGVKY